MWKYDPDTGVVWRICGSRLKRAGSREARHGYIRIRFGKRMVFAHHIAWLLANGEHCEVIDHINGNPSDNRLCNLRSTTQANNAKNRRMGSDNTSGVKGVYAFEGRWRAMIRADGRRISLGLFNTKEEAGAAYAKAALTHHGEFAAPVAARSPHLTDRRAGRG